MKKFITATLLFAAFISLSLILLCIICPSDSTHYMNGYQTKNELLLQQTDNERIILVGGSNVAFGFDCNVIQDSLKVKRDVINTGIHAGLGFKFILDNICLSAKRGDAIILAPEYSFFFENINDCGMPLIEVIMNVDPSKYKMLSLGQIMMLVRQFPLYSKQRMTQTITKMRLGSDKYIDLRKSTAYASDAFNDRGDVVKHWSLASRGIESKPFNKFGTDFDDKSFLYFLSCVNHLRDIGCDVYLLPCTVSSSMYSVFQSKIREIEDRLESEDLQYILPPITQVYADSLYFDTHMHLLKEGAIQRSLLLANRLNAEYDVQLKSEDYCQ